MPDYPRSWKPSELIAAFPPRQGAEPYTDHPTEWRDGYMAGYSDAMDHMRKYWWRVCATHYNCTLSKWRLANPSSYAESDPPPGVSEFYDKFPHLRTRSMATLEQLRMAWRFQSDVVRRNTKMFVASDFGVVTNAPVCWACLEWTPKPERAHILPVSMGGDDDPMNIHLLCPKCHIESERLHGDGYWQWISTKWCKAEVEGKWAKLNTP